jgi:hypothetical protein
LRKLSSSECVILSLIIRQKFCRRRDLGKNVKRPSMVPTSNPPVATPPSRHRRTSGPSLKSAVLNFDCNTVGKALNLGDTVRPVGLALCVPPTFTSQSSNPCLDPRRLSFVEVVDSLLGSELLSSLVGKGSLVINQISLVLKK